VPARRGDDRQPAPDNRHNNKEIGLLVLEKLAKLCAVLAGVLLTAITLMTCGSLIGRNTIGVSIVGAFELTGVAAGAAIALFMPLCQLRRGNIIVDFFTARLQEATNDKLDRFGALLLALIFALLAWRSTLGGINVWQANSETQIMGFPEWVVYACMVPAFALTALIALRQTLFGFGGMKPEDPIAALEPIK
jgi:TRAP-type C4-dicarboxylate transport system permease small subunit